MQKYLITILAFFAISNVFAQNTVKITVKDSITGESLLGISIFIDEIPQGITDESGSIVLNISTGEHNLSVSSVGYQEQTINLTLPYTQPQPIIISLIPEMEEMEEVTITSTRSTRTIRDIPTRVEFIAGEELEEKGNMKPGDIRMLLNESTGIQTQQTSATSANSSIRIQGLDGRYTQILKDGFPLYSGAASGLGLLQTPPLDLKQVEIIKGSASTLYGGGAIAGLVNLISKTPSDERELRFLINGTSALGLDLNGFYSQKFEKIGLTVFASRNSNKAYDPADNNFTAIPKFERYNFNPKIFADLSENTKLIVGVNTAFETRLGGDMAYIDNKDQIARYFEKNTTQRISSQTTLTHRLGENQQLTFRNSIGYFDRIIEIPDFTFNGSQVNSFSELTYSYTGEISEWITGTTLLTDEFDERGSNSFPLRNYNQITFGGFIQNTFKAKDWLHIETGLRGDYVKDYGFALLPRASLLFKWSTKFTSRFGGGLGYKTPTIFTDESERIQFRNVLPISTSQNVLEKSYGVNIDGNYKTNLDELSISINQLFFFTKLNRPLLLEMLQNGNYQFINSFGHITSKGAETNVKLEYDDFKLFLGYTYVDATIEENGISKQNPLTAKHRLNNVLMYEVEESWKIGLEAYYYSKQQLTDGTTGRSYWTCGAMVEKLWENFSIYINFENFTDTRQTKFDSIYTGPATNPVFKDIYAPLDGFVVNAGIKIML
ncbi:TonB-dependent receptor [Flavobacterium sp. PLA-1-15]|uniref:TonB-dependent receptor n=1 Tax=Flavobacterium sp. PLA-1-15 TaxID=3380533 RepID=UPI003B779028